MLYCVGSVGEMEQVLKRNKPNLGIVFDIPVTLAWRYRRKESEWEGDCSDGDIDRAPFAIARGDKRVSNSKIKSQLGVTLNFPSYRQGLSAIHEGDIRPFDW